MGGGVSDMGGAIGAALRSVAVAPAVDSEVAPHVLVARVSVYLSLAAMAVGWAAAPALLTNSALRLATAFPRPKRSAAGVDLLYDAAVVAVVVAAVTGVAALLVPRGLRPDRRR